MPTYYFDIETVPREEYVGERWATIDPLEAKIITIQYQQLDARTGKPLDELVILKEWEEGSERNILEKFKRLYLSGYDLDFIPVGSDLAFESTFMKYKLKKYWGLEHLQLGHRPMIDINSTLVMINEGQFNQYNQCLGECGPTESITDWYYQGDWESIELFVKREARNFIRTYTLLMRELPKLGDLLP